MEEHIAQLQTCMYQYSRAIYRSIKDLIDPYVDHGHAARLPSDVLEACEQTMERLANDPQYFAKPDRALFQDIRRYFPITQQAQVAWAVREGVAAAVGFIEQQIEAGAFDGGDRPLPRDDPQGQGLPAHAAAGARLLPVAPASRARARALASQTDRATTGTARLALSSPRVARHRQADPPALARRLPDGRTAAVDRPRRQVERRGLLRDVRRGLRTALLLRPRGADRARRAAPLAARRVHRRGALHAALRALLPARARARPTTSWRR